MKEKSINIDTIINEYIEHYINIKDLEEFIGKKIDTDEMSITTLSEVVKQEWKQRSPETPETINSFFVESFNYNTNFLLV